MFMQMVEKISISSGTPVMALPLSFVVALSMIKDAYEDYKRHKSDKSENESLTQVYNRESNSFETV